MSEITLGDYAGYLFQELVRAREMADAYSLQVAQRYRADDVLEHFAVPRFRIPKLELTAPVLISGAAYRESIRFDLEPEPFIDIIVSHIRDVIRQIRLRLGLRRPIDRDRPGDATVDRAMVFYKRLVDERHVAAWDSLIAIEWSEILEQGLVEVGLIEEWARADPGRDLLRSSQAAVASRLKAHIVVDRTTLESLLVNPETTPVKDGSSEASVFTLRAELVEEGFYLRSVKDGTGHTSTVVEFD